MWREISYFASLSKNVINPVFLKQGLHNTPDVLRETLQAAIDDVEEEKYDAVLVGYGLCSNGLAGIKARNIPVVAVRAHDCITFLLGSKERYREYFDKNPGTYWYSPGWIDTGWQPGKDRNRRQLAKFIEKYGEENAQYLMDMENGWYDRYSDAAYVDLNFGENGDFKDFTRNCANYLNWNYKEVQGEPSLVVDWLKGKWDDDRYLVVNPGEEIQASGNKDIIGIK